MPNSWWASTVFSYCTTDWSYPVGSLCPFSKSWFVCRCFVDFASHPWVQILKLSAIRENMSWHWMNSGCFWFLWFLICQAPAPYLPSAIANHWMPFGRSYPRAAHGTFKHWGFLMFSPVQFVFPKTYLVCNGNMDAWKPLPICKARLGNCNFRGVGDLWCKPTTSYMHVSVALTSCVPYLEAILYFSCLQVHPGRHARHREVSDGRGKSIKDNMTVWVWQRPAR